MRLVLLSVLLLTGCDGCNQQADPFLWLEWHNYRVEQVKRIVPPTIGTWPCESWQEGWRATATRTSPEWESPCGTVRAVLTICCPATNKGPCHGREIGVECVEEEEVL
jgi:hypothetical protein